MAYKMAATVEQKYITLGRLLLKIQNGVQDGRHSRTKIYFLHLPSQKHPRCPANQRRPFHSLSI